MHEIKKVRYANKISFLLSKFYVRFSNLKLLISQYSEYTTLSEIDFFATDHFFPYKTHFIWENTFVTPAPKKLVLPSFPLSKYCNAAIFLFKYEKTRN